MAAAVPEPRDVPRLRVRVTHSRENALVYTYNLRGKYGVTTTHEIVVPEDDMRHVEAKLERAPDMVLRSKEAYARKVEELVEEAVLKSKGTLTREEAEKQVRARDPHTWEFFYRQLMGHSPRPLESVEILERLPSEKEAKRDAENAYQLRANEQTAELFAQALVRAEQLKSKGRGKGE